MTRSPNDRPRAADDARPARHPDDTTGHAYLWDGSGPPDPGVQAVERAVAGLGHNAAPPELSAGVARRRPRARPRVVMRLALAAALALAAGAAILSRRGDAPGWEVLALEGTPRIDARAVPGAARLRPGQWLRTDESSRARLAVADIGTVTVDPATRVRLVGSRPDHHRMELASGRVSAFITAPPRLFFIETASATVIDMGCIYELQADERGEGLLRVSVGLVELERAGRVWRVPAGHESPLRAGRNPGTPRRVDAPPALVEALDRLDAAGADAPDALAELARVAGDADAVTLWHAAREGTGAGRSAVLARLAQAVPPPAGVDPGRPAGVTHADLDAWWPSVERR